MSDGGPPVRRFFWADVAAASLAVPGFVLCLRARANYAPCAFLPFALPAILALASRAYRLRLLGGVRALWRSLDADPDAAKTAWAAALAFVVVPSVLVFLANDHFDLALDSCPVVPTAVSLITEGNTDLDEFYRDVPWWRKTSVGAGGLPYFLQRSGGRLYSAYPVGMVPLAVPVVALARLAGANLTDPNVQTRLEKLTASVVAAVALGVFFLIALHLVRPAPALATTALLTFASGMATTVAQNLWQHDGVILGTLVLMFLEFRNPGRRGAVAQGVVCGLLPACRITSVAFLAPFGVWVLVRSPRRALTIAAVAAGCAAPWVAYYLAVYGSPFGPTSGQMRGALWSADIWGPLAGVVLSPGRGLLTYQPWVILAPLAVLPAVRRGGARREGARGPAGWEFVCVAAVVLLVAVVSAWQSWHGGYCWGSRLVVEVVPLCALVCARPVAALLASAPGRGVVVSLALLGTMVHVPSLYLGAFRWNAVYADSRPEAVWSWSRAPFLAPINLPPR